MAHAGYASAGLAATFCGSQRIKADPGRKLRAARIRVNSRTGKLTQGINDLLILAPLTLALSAYFIHRFRAPAARLGILDAPGGRKLHDGLTPLVGGLAKFVAFAFCALQLVAAAVLIAWGDFVIAHLGVLPALGHVEFGWMAVPFTLICVVGLVNAVKMLDGADGLAGGRDAVGAGMAGRGRGARGRLRGYDAAGHPGLCACWFPGL